MDPKTRQDDPNVTGGLVHRYHGKRTSRDHRASKKVGKFMQGVGMALIVTDPYIYLSFMALTQGAPLLFVRWLLAPIFVLFAGAIIYNLGRKLCEK